MEEDLLIVKLHLVHGNRWCDIAKQVDGRTDNAIKNRYNSNLRKRLNELEFMKLLKQAEEVKGVPIGESARGTNEQDECEEGDEEREDSVTLEAIVGETVENNAAEERQVVEEVENLSAFCDNLATAA